MPSIGRRELLGGAAALVGGSYGAHRLYRGRRDASFDSWTPEEGTWPLRRYDPANTAHNPHASPPREEPETRALATFPDDERYLRPLVGPDGVVLSGDGLAMVSDGDATALGDAKARFAGFGPDGRLHAARDIGPNTELVGYDDGEERYRHAIGDNVWGLAVGSREVYVGASDSKITAFHPGSGSDWAVDGMKPSLANGRLYVAGLGSGPVAYEARSGIDRHVSVGPKRAWTGPGTPTEAKMPAVADGRLAVGGFGIHGRSSLVAVDAATGERLWEPRSFGDSDVRDISTPALVGREGYVAAGVDGLSAGVVARLDMTSGETVWRDETGWYAYGPRYADGTLVVVGDVREGEAAPARKVRAYDAASGAVLWTVTFPGEHGAHVALVGDRVLATVGRTLYELA